MQRRTDVGAEGTDIGSLGAVHIDADTPPLSINVQEFQSVNGDRARRNLHRPSLPHEIRGALPADLDCRVDGGTLGDAPAKVCEYRLDRLRRRQNGVLCARRYLPVDIPRIRRIAKGNLGTIGLIRPLKILHESRSTPKGNRENPCRSRIQRPRMADALLMKDAPHDIDDIVRGHPRRLQYIDESVHGLRVQLLPDGIEDRRTSLGKGRVDRASRRTDVPAAIKFLCNTRDVRPL